MKHLKYIIPGVALAFIAVSCKPELEAPAPDTGSVDLSHYVAAGDYLTAGFMNGGLTPESQQYAYPQILAEHFSRIKAVSGFVQPSFSAGNGTQTIRLTGIGADGIPQFSGMEEFEKLILTGCSTAPASIYEQYSTSPAQTAAIQNFGVPGLLINQIRKPGLGNDANAGKPADFNPYFERLLPANDNQTYVQAVSSANATFFTLWVGMGDVVNYALSGASCANLPATNVFRAETAAMLDSLSRIRKQANNRFISTRKGVICNIPSVRDFAFNQLIDNKALVKRYQDQFGSNTEIWITQRLRPSSTEYDTVKIGFEDVVMQRALKTLGENRTVTVAGQQLQVRHGLSEFSPLTNDEVLDAIEVKDIDQRISEYNGIISSLVSATNQPYAGWVIRADVNALFNNLKNGINYNGVLYTSTPLTGGVYTLDLFSLTPRGQALVANRIIQSMNLPATSGAASGFGTRIPEININDYPLLKTE